MCGAITNHYVVCGSAERSKQRVVYSYMFVSRSKEEIKKIRTERGMPL